ncbi:MAG: PIN domain-containing protein [Pirellula sp.]|jgi:predicted nucleic acid-binding protein
MNYTQGKRFLDTNVLFYSCDTSDAIKHQKALNLIAECSRDNSGVLSVQVLGEFFHATVVRKKLLTAEEAERAVMAFRSAMKCASIEPQDVFDAIEVHRRYQTRYWDSLIIAIAARLECIEILSEDLNDGQTYMGVLVSNPFRVE